MILYLQTYLSGMTIAFPSTYYRDPLVSHGALQAISSRSIDDDADAETSESLTLHKPRKFNDNQTFCINLKKPV